MDLSAGTFGFKLLFSNANALVTKLELRFLLVKQRHTLLEQYIYFRGFVRPRILDVDKSLKLPRSSPSRVKMEIHALHSS